MANDLVIARPKGLTLYAKMSRAIAECYKLDECKDIIDKSVAMATYYEQIKDTKTQVMYERVKMRAWRRIGEIFSVVDFTGCETQTSKIKKIRAKFSDDKTVAEISDSRLLQIIKLMAVTESEFEQAIKTFVGGSIESLILTTPTKRAEIRETIRQQEVIAERYKGRDAAADRAANKAANLQHAHDVELRGESETAMREIGITLERKDRLRMKQVVFLIKKEVHEVMRQAAFDKRITMQEVLRRGLKLWLEANGYDFPTETVDRVFENAG